MKIHSIQTMPYSNNAYTFNKTNNVQNPKNVNFEGVMHFPQSKTILNPLQVVSITMGACVLNILGQFSKHINRMDIHWPQDVKVIKKGSSDVENYQGASYNFSTGTNYQMVERGEIKMSNGDIYEFENKIETPEHCLLSKENKPCAKGELPEAYKEYFNSRQISSGFSKALSSQEDFNFINATLTKKNC